MMYSKHYGIKNVMSFVSLLPLIKLGQIMSAEAAIQAVPSTGPKINVCEAEGEKKGQILSSKNKLRRNLILKGQMYI